MTNEWFEKGELPPVGWHGECTLGAKVQWHECVILTSNFTAVLNYEKLEIRNVKISEFVFRPIKSEREKAIEAVINEIKSGCDYEHSKQLIDWVLGRAYDAGLLRSSESK